MYRSTRWWQRLNVPRLVVTVQCVMSVLLLAAAAYLTPFITHTTNILPAYLLPAALFLLCTHTLAQSSKSSPPISRPTTRFITLSSVLSLGLLSYSLYCLFSPAPVLGQQYAYETLGQMSSSLRSFVSLALFYFIFRHRTVLSRPAACTHTCRQRTAPVHRIAGPR